MTDQGTVEKPPYRVPLMSEVAEVRGTNGLTLVSTFSGCGGSCLGFEMAGYDVRWASEFIPAAREVYALNHPGVPLDDRDIREVKPGEILKAAGLQEGELDVLEGSPPCASFSTAGRRDAHWGQVKPYSDTEQRTDDLFFEYVRLLGGLMPRVFVAENVSGLVKGVAKGYFKEVLAAMKAAGYRVKARMLDAQWLGVPQTRQRVIFMGVREDLERDPVYPSPLPYRYTIRDALPHVASVVHDTSGEWGAGDVTHKPSPAITVGVNSLNSLHFKVTDLPPQVGRHVGLKEDVGDHVGASLETYAVGPEWDKLKPGEQSEKYFSLVKTDANQPCPTVTAMGVGGSNGVGSPGGVASVTHPNEKRKFTIAELRRICSFPDDFELTGTYQQRWERLGRAVPPLMMRAVAEAIRDGVLAP